MEKLKTTFNIYLLAAKYWLQGDSWKFAKEYAESIVLPFRRK